MSNYTGPERRKDAGPAVPDAATQQRQREQFKAILRWALTLSSLAMVAFAGLTFFGTLPLPQWMAFLFVAVAAIDVCIAYVVFGPTVPAR